MTTKFQTSLLKLFSGMGKAGLFFLFFLIGTVSFIILSPVYSPFLNSDNAVHILMTYDLHLPGDSYYWGQTRLGSIIPLCAHALCRVLPLSFVLADSLVLYALLFITVITLSGFFRSNAGKLGFCLLFFFPLPLLDYTLKLGQPYSAQFCFTALGLNSLIRLRASFLSQQTGKTVVWLGAFILSFLVSFWASEMTAVSLVALILAGSVRFMQTAQIRTFCKTQGKTIALMLGMLFISISGGAMILLFAKTHVRFVLTPELPMLAPMSEIGKGLLGLGTDFLNTFSGSRGHLIGLMNGLLLLSLVTGLTILVKQFFVKKEKPDFLILFFLLNTLGAELLVLGSKWVAVNGYNLRYQTFPYLSLLILLFLIADRYRVGRLNKFMQGITYLLIGVSVSACLKIYLTKEKRCDDQKSISELQQLHSLEKCGIIGDYWHSYLLACADPKQIKATPWEGGRNPAWVDSTLKQRVIYLVKDNWLPAFPKQLPLFGHTLVFSGDSITRLGWELGKYSNTP